MDAVALRRRIQDAFSVVARPGRDAIAPHRCVECDELRDDLASYTCDAVPIEMLGKHVWDLPLLSSEAKQYFLPAWLTASLIESGWDFTDAAIQDINSNHRYDPPSGYTDDQWQVLLEWLDHHAETGDMVTKENAQRAKASAGGRSEA